jgi:hypothetical protein
VVLVSGTIWRRRFDAGFVGCKADPDVWLRPAVKLNGEKVYEYALCYVDDVIFQGLDPAKEVHGHAFSSVYIEGWVCQGA